ncbi:hypothetical protein DO97_15725 [Neosynechococcus sphagnicola sy1]|uniref:Knr4/Smi1-like domain-containing protein n=1 Tax=Neosynechococcus sphagnicola sy1 TaxID=1497020 RepID=A0A098TLK9_9CYAN|nr:SMI1/KNR4 family protein [Neosynechococcus sphagnicola]KGF71733.1 hypothetical protein DO97_15725 [Neosynechococcus sphagnicola sy1]
MPFLESLHSAVQSHTGQFSCSEINREENTKVVHFRHVGLPPDAGLVIPKIQGLEEFYGTYSQLTLYFEEESGDAAYFIASPSQWEELNSDFRPWLDVIDEEEVDEFLPNWINDCIVIGEIPRSGNYLLVPTVGSDAGKVFEFEHDGFEFLELGLSLPDFVARTLDLDSGRLTAIASHIRFITPTENRQWWIEELRDNRGNVICSEA